MTQIKETAPRKLHEDVHQALKLWHGSNAEGSPLEYLYLYQQARRLAGNTRQATNQVLLAALEALSVDHDEDARLLRMRFLDRMAMHVVANRLNLAEPTANKKQRQALVRLAATLEGMECQARKESLSRLEKQVNLPAQTRLFGVEEYLEKLKALLLFPEPPWLVSIEGMGGIGKTTLASVIVREIGLDSRFEAVGWVSARQQDFQPHFGLREVEQPAALDTDTLVNALLEQFNPGGVIPASPAEKRMALTQILKSTPHLVVIDNLETVVDYQALLPMLRQLANPSKFILTSRHSLKAALDVSCVTVAELNLANTLAFLRYEAELRGLPALIQAQAEQLAAIYHVVGGNPLALKLVVGQVWVLPLSQVLENLKQAQGKRVDELYTFIYWQAWHALDPVGQQALVVMPLVQDGTIDQLAAISGLEMAELSYALEQLAALSLLEVSGDLEQRRYRIHRLTETFLLNEVVKWQSPE